MFSSIQPRCGLVPRVVALSAALGLVVTDAVAQQAEGGLLEEIVITAQKREERLSDAAVSAAVVSPDVLAQRNVANIADLNKIVPSLNLFETLSGRVPMALRGISTVSNQQTVGISSGVAVQIDGIPYPADSDGAYAIEDVERVEVLRGPQSTLGGRTASAGVINVVTRGPSDVRRASAGLTLTDDGEYRVNGFLSGPLTDTLSFSLSGWKRHTERLQHNNNDNSDTYAENEGVRGKLRFAPSEQLDMTLALRAQKGRTVGSHFTYRYITPGANFFPYINGGLTQAQTLPGVTVGPENVNYNSPRPKENNADVEDFDGFFELNYTLANGATITSTTAYLDESKKTIQNLFLNSQYWVGAVGGPPTSVIPFFNAQFANFDIQQFTEELKLVSPAGARIEYVAGAFYSDSKVAFNYYRPFFGNYIDLDLTSKTKHLGVYGRLTFNDALPKTDLLVGLRANRDTIFYDFDQRQYGGLMSPNPFRSRNENAESKVVGDLTAQYHVNDQWMAYLTYARGYKPIVYNTGTTLTDNNPLPPVGAEKINHFELGSKGTFLDNRVSLNLAVFDTVYTNYQVQTYLDTGGLVRPLVLQAAGEAETKGLEADSTIAFNDTTTLTLAAALINAKFNRFTGASCYPNQAVEQPTICAGPVGATPTQSLAGKDMPVSPKVKYNVNLARKLVADAFDTTLAANYAFTGSQQFQTDQNPYTKQGSYGILDLSATFASKSGKLSATLFANNVLNEFYVTDIEDFWAGLWGGNSNAVVHQPARDAQTYYGVRVNWSL